MSLGDDIGRATGGFIASMLFVAMLLGALSGIVVDRLFVHHRCPPCPCGAMELNDGH